VKLVLVAPKKKSRKNILGSGIGNIWVAPDWGSPETNAKMFNDSKDSDHFRLASALASHCCFFR
jgi:hypothetical protein